ncbi:MAG: DUF4143 domain-containing protein [Clostridiales bacterium]|jgi:predicted AAA+ superfamily ATPase|nr:DUF4143 domain-containing protein [Clostridiales bacterium]
MEKEYLNRIADYALDGALDASGAVLIEGAKWCGKTRTARRKANSILLMQDPDQHDNYMRIANTKPSLLLSGPTPRLIDEWQDAPILWDAVRFAVDERCETAQFILTGSAVPLDNAVLHTGTGRISRFKMRTMSLYESLESNGQISLGALFDEPENIEGHSTLTIERLAYALVRGGWPQSVGERETAALRRVYDYVEAVINQDVNRVDGIEKNPSYVRALMRSLARNSASMANNETIRKDMAADDAAITPPTVASYLNALRRIHVVEDLSAWNPALRSKTALRTSVTRHYADPSIAAAVLRATQQNLLYDFNTFGLLFESLCVRDLRVYAQAIDGEVFHYRDKNGLEADAVVQLKDGRWGAVEVKMGSKEIDGAAKNLIALRSIVDTERMREPSFLAVVTATDIAYRRKDGVYVVPIGCLKN